MTTTSLQEFSQSLREQIVQGEIEPALDRLRNYLNASVPTLRNEVILFTIRYNRLRDEERKGVIPRDEAQAEQNRLVSALLELLDDVPRKLTSILEDRGDRLREQGDSQQALSLYLQAVEVAEQEASDDKIPIARLYRKIGRAHRDHGDSNQALSCYEKGLVSLKTESSGPTRDIEEARLLVERAAIYIEQNKKEKARVDAGRARCLLEGDGATSELADAIQELAIIDRELGERDKFLKQMQKARDIYERVADTQGKIRVLGNWAIDALHWGDHEEAIESFGEMLDMPEVLASPQTLANINLNLAIAYTDAGRLEEAGDYARKSLEGYRKIEGREGEGQLMSYAALAEVLKEEAVLAAQTGNCETARNRMQEARRVVNEALGLVDRAKLGGASVVSSQFDLYRIMAEAYTVVGEYEKSKELLLTAQELGQRQDIGIEPQTLAQGDVVWAKLAEISEGYQQAYQRLNQARDVFVEQGYWKDVVRVDILRAKILAKRREFREAKDVLEKARDLAEMRKRTRDMDQIARLLDDCQLQ